MASFLFAVAPAAGIKVTFQSSGSFTTTTVNSSTVTANTGQWYANSATNVTGPSMTVNNASSIDNNTGLLPSGTSVIVRAIRADRTASYPLLLR